jgi:beta-lactamase class D
MIRFTRRRALFALAAPLVLGRTDARAEPLAAPADWRLAREMEWPAFARRFEEAGTQGTLVVLDARIGGRLVVHPERSKTGYPPSSTFKIPNALIALQTAAAKDVDDEIFKWSGARSLVDEKPLLPAACDADLTLRSAFRHSCIPVFQELARRIGPEAYKEWLTKFDYGDARISGAPLDEFWLRGDLRISADQQTKFLRRLIIKTLPVAPRAAALTEDLMFIEKIGDTAIHGKTGYVFTTTPRLGWWVGYAQRGEDVVLLALNLDMTKPEHGAARYALVKEALKGIGLL